MKLKVNSFFCLVSNSTLLKSTGVYSVTGLLNGLIPFLLLPVLTEYLSKSDFGIVTMFTTLAGFVTPFVGLNLEGAIARTYYNKTFNIAQYIANCFFLLILSISIVVIIFLFFIDEISILSGVPKLYTYLVPIYCALQFFITIRLTLWQVHVKPMKYGMFQILNSILNFSLSIFLIITLKLNWEGRIIAMIVSVFVLSLFSLYTLFKSKLVIFKIEISYIKDAFKYGIGLIPHAIGAYLIFMTNRFFLTKMVSIDETGLYSVANQIIGLISYFTLAFNNAFVPWLYEKLSSNSDSANRKIVKLTYFYFIFLVLSGFFLYLILPLGFKYFINIRFVGALIYSPWIIGGFIFQGMYFMVTNYISFVGKTYYQALVTICVGLLNIPLNYIMIKEYGAIGAAISFAIIYGLFFLTTWCVSSKLYKMPWSLN